MAITRPRSERWDFDPSRVVPNGRWLWSGRPPVAAYGMWAGSATEKTLVRPDFDMAYDATNPPTRSRTRQGPAVSFVLGSTQFMDHAAAIVDDSAEVWSFTIYYRVGATGAEQSLVEVSNSGTSGNTIGITQNSNNTIRVRIRGTTTNSATTTTTVAVGETRLVTGLNRGGLMHIFLDGVLESTDNQNGGSTGLDTTSIGRIKRATPEAYLTGDVFFVLIHDYAVTDEWCKRLARDPFSPFQEDIRFIGRPRAAAPAGANPKGPFGHPFHGPFAGPIGFWDEITGNEEIMRNAERELRVF